MYPVKGTKDLKKKGGVKGNKIQSLCHLNIRDVSSFLQNEIPSPTSNIQVMFMTYFIPVYILFYQILL